MIFSTSYHGMLRTTNGGDNWILLHPSLTFYQLDKIDSTTLYAIGRWNGVDRIQRTYDKGLSWDSVSVSSNIAFTGLSFINHDTGWLSGANYLNYSTIWRTTDGGVTLTELMNNTGRGRLFFLKQKVNGEYIGWHYSYIADDKLWKTTNSGLNWFQVTRPPAQYPGYFEFYDDNTGWFTWNTSISGGIFKTTDGGMNWNSQYIPAGNGIHNTFFTFKIINPDTLYGCGGYRDLGMRDIGLIWKTTNGGINWGYQQPDTNYYNGFYHVLDFINENTGWTYEGNGVHTTNGGGPITFTAINNNTQIIQKDYVLYQNYPNPFNSITNFKYQILNSGNIKIILYDISGKEVRTIMNERLQAGIHEVKFDAGNLSSGVYFYVMFADNIRVDTKRMVLVK